MKRFLLIGLLLTSLSAMGCGDDDNGTEADKLGVGAQCTSNDDCTEDGQSCLLQFKGGYCGVADCTTNADCPEGSGCITHDDGNNYCFMVCTDKSQCNTNRDAANESNCSGSVTWADTDLGKACVPPSAN